jgi:hypothetical protein
MTGHGEIHQTRTWINTPDGDWTKEITGSCLRDVGAGLIMVIRNRIMSPEEVRMIYQTYVTDQKTRYHRDYDTVISTGSLPFEKYEVYERWLPLEPVEVLFIAESPPWANTADERIYRYFYNPYMEKIRGLSRALFDHLDITNQKKRDCLERFRERNFFLTDTIKCIFDKREHKSIPDSLIRYSARNILAAEIGRLDPGIIFVLGGTAFIGLKTVYARDGTLERFTNLAAAVNGTRERPLELQGRSVIFSPFPNSRNNQDAIGRSFATLRRVVGMSR